MTTQKYVTEREKNHCCPQLKLPELKKLRCKINNIPQFVSSARSSSVHHGLLHTYIQTSFPTISNLEQSCLYTFIIQIQRSTAKIPLSRLPYIGFRHRWDGEASLRHCNPNRNNYYHICNTPVKDRKPPGIPLEGKLFITEQITCTCI